MLFALLFSSLGITADYHYCSGEVKNVSLTGAAQSCHKTGMHCDRKPDGNTSCCAGQTSSGKAFLQLSLEDLPAVSDGDSCCSNELKLHQLDTDTIIFPADNVPDVSFSPGLLLALQTVFCPGIGSSIKNLLPEKYIPPLLERHIIILFQNFLL